MLGGSDETNYNNNDPNLSRRGQDILTCTPLYEPNSKNTASYITLNAVSVFYKTLLAW